MNKKEINLFAGVLISAHVNNDDIISVYVNVTESRL